MQKSASQKSRPSSHTLGAYQLSRTPIGEGSYGTVYKGIKNGKTYAIKVFQLNTANGFTEELNAYREFDHENVVKMHDYGKRAVFQPSDGGKTYTCNFLVFDYVVGGELFDVIIREPQVPDAGIRTIFKSILAGIKHVHDKNMAHRDLKMENILLDENFVIKVADFGTAKAADDEGNLKTHIGTPGYMAPEVASGKYNAFAADVFSLGCVLFMILTRIPVTEGKCIKTDGVFKHLYNGRPDLYWEDRIKISSRYRSVFTAPSDLRDLISGMLCYDPERRLTMQQVMDHDYLKGKTASQSQLSRFFSKRLAGSNPEQEKIRQKMLAPKSKVYMSGDSGAQIEDMAVVLESLDEHETTAKKFNVLYSEAHPVLLMQLIQEHLEHENVTPIINEDNWSVSYQQPMKNLEYDDESKAEIETEIKLNVQIDFQKFNSDRVALVFSTKDSGYAKWLLTEHFQQIAAENTAWGYQMTETEESAVERTNIRAELEAGI